MSYPKPGPSWIFDEIAEDWVPPVPRPSGDGPWAWIEKHQQWELVTPNHAGVVSD